MPRHKTHFYNCTSGCTSVPDLHEKKDWVAHEERVHNITWDCATCHAVFSHYRKLREHMFHADHPDGEDRRVELALTVISKEEAAERAMAEEDEMDMESDTEEVVDEEKPKPRPPQESTRAFKFVQTIQQFNDIQKKRGPGGPRKNLHTPLTSAKAQRSRAGVRRKHTYTTSSDPTYRPRSGSTSVTKTPLTPSRSARLIRDSCSSSSSSASPAINSELSPASSAITTPNPIAPSFNKPVSVKVLELEVGLAKRLLELETSLATKVFELEVARERERLQQM